MITDMPPWLLASAPPTVIAALLGAYVGVKYLRNGKKLPEDADTRGPLPPVACPGKPYFEETKVVMVRQEEGFRGMIHSWDKVAESIDNQTKAFRENAEQQNKAIIRLAEMAMKGRTS